MKERKISKFFKFLILILVCGIGYYIAVFIVPKFNISRAVPEAEISQGGEFYYSKVSELDKAFNGDFNLVVKFKGTETEYFPSEGYKNNIRQIYISTLSDKGYQTNRFIENEDPKVKGTCYGNLHSISIVYKIAAFSQPGFPKEPMETGYDARECLESFCVKAHS